VVTCSGRISKGRIGEAYIYIHIYIYTYELWTLNLINTKPSTSMGAPWGPQGPSRRAAGRPAGRPAAAGVWRPGAGGELANWRMDSLRKTACLSQIWGTHYSQDERSGNWQKCHCTTYSDRGRGSIQGGIFKANWQKLKRDSPPKKLKTHHIYVDPHPSQFSLAIMGWHWEWGVFPMDEGS